MNEKPWQGYDVGDKVKVVGSKMRRKYCQQHATWERGPIGRDSRVGVYIGFRHLKNGVIHSATYDEQGYLEVTSSVLVALVVFSDRSQPECVLFEQISKEIS